MELHQGSQKEEAQFIEDFCSFERTWGNSSSEKLRTSSKILELKEIANSAGHVTEKMANEVSVVTFVRHVSRQKLFFQRFHPDRGLAPEPLPELEVSMMTLHCMGRRQAPFTTSPHQATTIPW